MNPFEDFKFNIGDIVRHVTTKHNSALVQEETVACVITMRSLHDEGNGSYSRSYAIHSISGRSLFDLECELEAVDAKTV